MIGPLLWNLPRRSLIGYFRHDRAPNNSTFASVGREKAVFLWDVSNGTVIRRIYGHDMVCVAHTHVRVVRRVHYIVDRFEQRGEYQLDLLNAPLTSTLPHLTSLWC